MTEHSWYSPSSAARVIACPASLKASENAPDTSSRAANLGTECHDAMEKAIGAYSQNWTEKDFSEPKTQIPLCEIAYSRVEELLSAYSISQTHLEHRVDLGDFGDDSVFGTVDVLGYGKDNTLLVLDYKFGYTPVDVKWNPQLMIYALGALHEDLKKVVLVIVQPKIQDEAFIWETTPEELVEWSNDTLFPSIDSCVKDDAPFNPGPQCQFCPKSKMGCPAQINMYVDPVRDLTVDGKDVIGSLSDEQLTSVLVDLPRMEETLAAVKHAAQARAEAGTEFVGFKLVKATKHLKWADPAKAAKFLKAKRLKMSVIYTQKLLTPGQAQKAVAKKRWTADVKEEFSTLFERPDGGLVLVSEADRREAVVINRVEMLDDALLEDNINQLL